MKINHKNIVKTISIIETENDKYTMVLMDYLPNSIQLQKLLEDVDINIEDKIIKFSVDISEGLQYCHKKQILHLDVKPRNILVCGDTCKICDFGNSVLQVHLKNCYKFEVRNSYNIFVA